MGVCNRNLDLREQLLVESEVEEEDGLAWVGGAAMDAVAGVHGLGCHLSAAGSWCVMKVVLNESS